MYSDTENTSTWIREVAETSKNVYRMLHAYPDYSSFCTYIVK